MNEIAAQYEAAIRYARFGDPEWQEIAEKYPHFPHAVFADLLEENGWHHDDETLRTLRQTEIRHLNDVAIARHPDTGKVVAMPSVVKRVYHPNNPDKLRDELTREFIRPDALPRRDGYVGHDGGPAVDYIGPGGRWIVSKDSLGRDRIHQRDPRSGMMYSPDEITIQAYTGLPRDADVHTKAKRLAFPIRHTPASLYAARADAGLSERQFLEAGTSRTGHTYAVHVEPNAVTGGKFHLRIYEPDGRERVHRAEYKTKRAAINALSRLVRGDT